MESLALTIIRAIAADRALEWTATERDGEITIEFSREGERWTARGPDLYAAACAAAEMMGWDLEG